MLPSAGPQYKDVASVQQVGALAKKGADKIAKGATVARNAQNQYVTGKYKQIRKGVKELKNIEAEREKQGITSFGDPETGAVFPLKTEYVLQKPQGPRRATSGGTGPSVSRAQQATRRATSAVRQAASNVVNDVKTEAVKETKNAVGNAVADVVNSEEFADKAKGVGAGIGAAAGAALTKTPKGAAVGAQIGTGAAEVVTKVAQNVVNKRAQRGKK